MLVPTNMSMIYKSLFVFSLAFFFVPFASADTVTFTQTLYGSGDTVTFDINYSSLTATEIANSDFFLMTAPEGTVFRSSYTWLDGDSSGTGYVLDFNLLSPDTGYFLASGFPGCGLDSASQLTCAQNVWLQANGAVFPNTSQAFPQQPDQLGFVYFETDADSNIQCYSVDFSSSNGRDWLNCEIPVTAPVAPPDPDLIPLIVSENLDYRIASTTCQFGNGSSTCQYNYDTSTSSLNVEANVKFDSLLFMLGFLLLFAGIGTWYTIIRKLS